MLFTEALVLPFSQVDRDTLRLGVFRDAAFALLCCLFHEAEVRTEQVSGADVEWHGRQGSAKTDSFFGVPIQLPTAQLRPQLPPALRQTLGSLSSTHIKLCIQLSSTNLAQTLHQDSHSGWGYMARAQTESFFPLFTAPSPLLSLHVTSPTDFKRKDAWIRQILPREAFQELSTKWCTQLSSIL